MAAAGMPSDGSIFSALTLSATLGGLTTLIRRPPAVLIQHQTRTVTSLSATDHNRTHAVWLVLVEASLWELWWRSDSLTGNYGFTGSTGTTCLWQKQKVNGVVRSGHPLVHSTSSLSTIIPRNTTITKCALDQGYFLS